MMLPSFYKELTIQKNQTTIPSFYKEFAINEIERRIPLAGYLLFVFISCMVGNSLILLATHFSDTMKLNKCMVVLMQHIALSDVTLAISNILPAAVSVLLNGWALQDTPLIYLLFLLNAISSPTTSILICLLTLTKLLFLHVPTARVTYLHVHGVCAALWITAGIFPVCHLIWDSNLFFFDYISYGLVVEPSSIWSRKLMDVTMVVSFILPVVIVIISTLLILLYLMRSRRISNRVGGHVRWRGIGVVVATATVFTVSYIPFSVGYLAYLFGRRSSQYLQSEVIFSRVVVFLPTINIVGNFYIYYLSIPSFKVFVGCTVKRFLGRFCGRMDQQRMVQYPRKFHFRV